MKVDTYRCDVCATVKAETNHWWIVTNSPEGLTVSPFDTDYRNDNDIDCCGAACVIKKVSEYLGTGV